jgi:hypothetical protein
MLLKVWCTYCETKFKCNFYTEKGDVEMKTFVASREDRYVWECPYCHEMCSDDGEDPAEQESVICEHCNKESICEHTE